MKRVALVCFLVACPFLAACLAVPTLADEPKHAKPHIDAEVAALVAGVARRHAACRGFKFSLRVAIETKPAPEAAEGVKATATEARDTFAILAADKPTGRPWRWWQRTIKDAEGKWILGRFVAYDGSKTHSFRRTPPQDDQPGLREGHVYPWEDWPGLTANVFDRVLFMQPNGATANLPLTDAARKLHLDRFRVASRQAADGHELIVLEGSSMAASGMKYRAVMTGKPEYMLHEWEAMYAQQNNRSLTRYRVQQLKRVGGMLYPASGSYHQAGIGLIEDLKYDFEVTSVVPIGEKARQLWLPAWPPATMVRDHINNKNFRTDAPEDSY